jgi:3-hydroxypropanoate dehydrogenase
MTQRLSDSVIDQLFRSARSIHTFKAEPISDETLKDLYDLLKWGPTAFNAQPARYVFVRSPQAKARLAPALSSTNRDKSGRAPVTVIVAYDSRFFERLPEELLSARTREMFTSDAALAEATAFRNATLQGAYLLLAARALGLSVGPMSGFDAEHVNREFFADRRHRANFLANIGYADTTQPRPRGPRFEFAEVAEVI